MPGTTQTASTSPASTRATLVGLIAAYDKTLRLANRSEPLPCSLSRHRRLGLLVARPVLHVLIVRHVDRVLRALTGRLSARAALASDPRADESDLALLGRYLQSLPAGSLYRHSLLFVTVVCFLVSYVLANHVFRTPEADLLGDLTSAALTLDRGSAVEAVNSSTLENTGGAAVITLWSLWAVLLLPLLGFREKRIIFTDRRIYTRERDACAAIGQRPPREIQLDLVTQAMLALSVQAFGAGTILYGLTRPTGEQQLAGASRYVVGGACVALGVGALVAIAATAWQRSDGRTAVSAFCQRLAGPLNVAVAVVFVALVAVALGSR